MKEFKMLYLHVCVNRLSHLGNGTDQCLVELPGGLEDTTDNLLCQWVGTNYVSNKFLL